MKILIIIYLTSALFNWVYGRIDHIKRPRAVSAFCIAAVLTPLLNNCVTLYIFYLGLKKACTIMMGKVSYEWFFLLKKGDEEKS